MLATLSALKVLLDSGNEVCLLLAVGLDVLVFDPIRQNRNCQLNWSAKGGLWLGERTLLSVPLQ